MATSAHPRRAADTQFPVSRAGEVRLVESTLSRRYGRILPTVVHDNQPWGWVTYEARWPDAHPTAQAVSVYRPGLTQLRRATCKTAVTLHRPARSTNRNLADFLTFLSASFAAIFVFLASGPVAGIIATVAFLIAQSFVLRHLRGVSVPDVRTVERDDDHFDTLAAIVTVRGRLTQHLDADASAADLATMMWAAADSPSSATQILDHLRSLEAAAAAREAAEAEQYRILHATDPRHSADTVAIVDHLTSARQALEDETAHTRRITSHLSSDDLR